MDEITTRPRSACPATLLIALTVAACAPVGEQPLDGSVGMNGGFEHTRSGLPINWIVYPPSRDPESHELCFDDVDYKEGKQSLRFLVHESAPGREDPAPGITQEYPVTPGAIYRIHFWIKTDACDWAVRIGGVDAWTARYEAVSSSGMAAGSWQRIEREYTVPEKYRRLRFELSIRSPGSLWIDDVTIEPVADGAAPPTATAD